MPNEALHPDESQIVIRQPSPDELAAVRTLRLEELNGDQPLPESVEPTKADQDPQAEPPGTHHVSRMVTRHDHRGQGIGAQVLSAAEQAAVEGHMPMAKELQS